MMSKREQGFTIIELMIATVVFSVILVSITMGVMYFTKSYYKGVYAASTQDAARSISEQISQSIQFSGTAPTFNNQWASTGYICAGSTEFIYTRGIKYDATASTTGMVSAPMSSGVCIDPGSVSTTKKQLLSKNMRLANLTVAANGSLYTIDVTVAYGDNDLLCVYGGTGNAACSASVTAGDSDLISDNIACKPGAGNEYCAVSHLKTTVQKRLP